MKISGRNLVLLDRVMEGRQYTAPLILPPKRASDQFEFCRASERRSLFEGVVTDRFYGVKNREASAAEQFDIDPEIGRDTLHQRQAFSKQFACSFHQNPHQTTVTAVEAPVKQVRFAEASG